MPRAAPRIDSRLLAALAKVDDPKRPIAETVRRVGLVADALGIPRPSYEQLRTYVHLFRARERYPGAGEILLEVALRSRAPQSLLLELPELDR
jgi:hypothetical protein